MFGQCQHRLHHVQVVYPLHVDADQRAGQEMPCFWLLPSRHTRSPGSSTALSKAMA